VFVKYDIPSNRVCGEDWQLQQSKFRLAEPGKLFHRETAAFGIAEFGLIGDATLWETRRFYRVLLKPLLRTHRRVRATHSCNTQLPGQAQSLQLL